jgi:3-oxosteroid 1-dehydrogenase
VPGYADYYPEAPGGLATGRSIEPVPFDGRALGAELSRLAPAYLPAPAGVVVTQADFRWLTLGPRHWRSMRAGLHVTGRMLRQRVLGRRLLSMGQALAAGLRAGLLSASVPVLLDTPFTGLTVSGSRVTGVRAGDQEFTARRGVILASGGFEQNAQMRHLYQREPIGTDWTTGAPGNAGDGQVAGVTLGAALDLMDDAWWGPSIPLPSGPFFCLAERSLPGSIMINAAGERFVNECAPYVDAVHAMYETDSIPAWLIFDQRYLSTYSFAGRPPGRPLSRRWAGVVFSASTLPELASLINVDGACLAKTVTRFGEFAASGTDLDFARGASAYDRYYGDPRVRPNPNLAPLARPPFYAARLMPGDLGTKGGLVTDARARVLRRDGSVIEGLYAAGNVSASVMGHSYAGAGATIGPAMTFAHIAALDLAG